MKILCFSHICIEFLVVLSSSLVLADGDTLDPPWLTKQDREVIDCYHFQQKRAKIAVMKTMSSALTADEKNEVIQDLFKASGDLLPAFLYFKGIKSKASIKRAIDFHFSVLVAHFKLWKNYDENHLKFRKGTIDAVWEGKHQKIFFDNPDTFYHTLLLPQLKENHTHYLVQLEHNPESEESTLFWNAQLYSQEKEGLSLLDKELQAYKPLTQKPHHPNSFVVTTQPEEARRHPLLRQYFILKANKDDESLIVRQYFHDKMKVQSMTLHVERYPMEQKEKFIKSGSLSDKECGQKTLGFLKRTYRKIAHSYLQYSQILEGKIRRVGGSSLYPNLANDYQVAIWNAKDQDELTLSITGPISDLHENHLCRYHALTVYDEFQRSIAHINGQDIIFADTDKKVDIHIVRQHQAQRPFAQNTLYIDKNYGKPTVLIRSLGCEEQKTPLRYELNLNFNWWSLLPRGNYLALGWLNSFSLLSLYK